MGSVYPSEPGSFLVSAEARDTRPHFRSAVSTRTADIAARIGVGLHVVKSIVTQAGTAARDGGRDGPAGARFEIS